MLTYSRTNTKHIILGSYGVVEEGDQGAGLWWGKETGLLQRNDDNMPSMKEYDYLNSLHLTWKGKGIKCGLAPEFPRSPNHYLWFS